MTAPVTVVGTDRAAAHAARALAAAGHAVQRAEDGRAAARSGAACLVCSADGLAALATLRPPPAIVALLERDTCEAALSALADGAHECVDADADGRALSRATALALARRAAADQARRDPLTGLVNRGLLHERLAAALAAIPDGPDALAVLFVDLDRFKAINDAHGHPAGDRVLVDIARRLQAGVRPHDVVGRYGGDEFVVICEHVTPGEARAIARRLAARLADPIGIDGVRHPVGASIGVAVTRDPSLPPVRMIALADAEMYRAKVAQRPAIAEAA